MRNTEEYRGSQYEEDEDEDEDEKTRTRNTRKTRTEIAREVHNPDMQE